MIKLYHSPFSRSQRPLWLLEELGVPFETVRLDMKAGQHKTPEYLKIHPLGKVPALVDGDDMFFESVALCMHLADRFPEKGLAPAPGTPERGHYYQWMLYAATMIEPLLLDVFIHRNYHPEDPAWKERADQALQNFGPMLKVVEDALGDRPYLVGERFTAADVVMGSVLAWADRMGMLADHPVAHAYVERLQARPAAVRSTSDRNAKPAGE